MSICHVCVKQSVLTLSSLTMVHDLIDLYIFDFHDFDEYREKSIIKFKPYSVLVYTYHLL